MNRALRALGTMAAAAAAAIVVSASVVAHSGEWGLFPDAPAAPAGGSLHVRGDVPSTGPIQLVLVGAGSETLLTTVDDAPNGHFDTFVTFPSDAAPGAWALEARAAGMQPARAAIQLSAGAPPGPDEEGSADAPPSAVTLPSDPIIPVPSTTGTDQVDLVPFAAAGLAVTALVVLMLRTRRSTTTR